MKINIGCRFTRARRATLRQGDPFGVSANSCRPHHVAARRITKQLGVLLSCFSYVSGPDALKLQKALLFQRFEHFIDLFTERRLVAVVFDHEAAVG